MKHWLTLGALALLGTIAHAQTYGNNIQGGTCSGSQFMNGLSQSGVPSCATPAGGGSSNTGFLNAGSNLSTALSTAGSNPTVIQVTQAITLSSGTTSIPRNVTIRFDTGGSLTGTGTVSFLDGGQVIAPTNQQIFASSVTVTGLTGDIPVEWFGAIGDGSITGGGTDNTPAIQATINALTSGHAKLGAHYYRTNASLTITKSNVGILGVSGGYSYPNFAPSTIIVNNSAGNDILQLVGNSSTYVAWNDFRNFSLQRTVVPTGSAHGFYVTWAGGYTIDHVQSFDSIYNFYFHSAPGFGVGEVRSTVAEWGFAQATAYASGTNVYGYYLDSSDGAAENTININLGATGTNNLSGVTSHGIYVTGTAINDVDVDNFQSGITSYGLEVYYTGSGAQGSAYDLHFKHITLDNCATACAIVQNIPTNGSVNFDDMYATSNSAGPAVVFLNSYNVSIEGAEIANVSNGGGLTISGGGSNILHGIKEEIINGGNGVYLTGTTKNLLSNIQIGGAAATAMASMVGLVSSSTNNQILNVVGNGSATYGVYADGSSTGNNLCNVNTSAPLNGIATTCSGSGGGGSSNVVGLTAAGGGYYNYSINGNNSDGTRLGILGNANSGTDPNLYVDTPAGGSVYFRPNGQNGNNSNFGRYGLGVGGPIVHAGDGTEFSNTINGGNFSEFYFNVANAQTNGKLTRFICRSDQGGGCFFQGLNDANGGEYPIFGFAKNSSGGVDTVDFSVPISDKLQTTTPTGSCPVSGAWLFAANGTANFCKAGTWEVVFTAP